MKKLIIVVLALAISCNSKPQQPMNDFKAYHELSNHKGSEDYEVVVTLKKELEIPEIYIDSVNKNLNVSGKTNPVDKTDALHNRHKVSFFGKIIDQGLVYTVLRDGTMWYTDEYNNWIINGDTTRYKYKDAFTNKKVEDPYEYKNTEKDFEKWLETFKELYDKSSFVKEDGTFYYLKGEDNVWYFTEAYFEDMPKNFAKQYPSKIDPSEIRMLDLENIMPDLVAKPEDLDTSLVKKVGYESTFFEESKRGRAFNYSAGWWYLDIYMPGGDTLKVKRFASFRDPEMKLYKIPAKHGGRDDVLFIVQQPNEIHPEQVGGMYVIRPRNYTETPEYKTQQARQEKKEEKRKQEQNKEAIKKRRSFIPDVD